MSSLDTKSCLQLFVWEWGPREQWYRMGKRKRRGNQYKNLWASCWIREVTLHLTGTLGEALWSSLQRCVPMGQKRSRRLAIGSCPALVKSGFVGINSHAFPDCGEEVPKEQEREIHSAGHVSASLILVPQQRWSSLLTPQGAQGIWKQCTGGVQYNRWTPRRVPFQSPGSVELSQCASQTMFPHSHLDTEWGEAWLVDWFPLPPSFPFYLLSLLFPPIYK